MKSFLKAIRGLIHKLDLVLGCITIVAAIYVIQLAAPYAVAEINKTKDNNESIVEIDNQLDQWPYEPEESLDIKIDSANVQWPYEISVQWWPEREKSYPYFEGQAKLGLVGRADITVSNPVSGAAVTIATQFFQ